MIYLLKNVVEVLGNDILSDERVFQPVVHKDMIILMDADLCDTMTLCMVDPIYDRIVNVVYPSIERPNHYEIEDLHFITRNPVLRELLERYIAKSAYTSYLYAITTKKRFYKGEEAIARDYMYSFYYAVDVIKGRFHIGEAAIKTNKRHFELYKEMFNLGDDV